MNNQAFVILPPPGMTVILQNQVLSPSAINQTPGGIQNGDGSLQAIHPNGETGIARNRYKRHGFSLLRGTPKVLGALQILIGSVHLTFGSLLLLFSGLYTPYIMSSRYPYWGGILFIISGSLLTLAEHYKVSCMFKGSLVLNIISSIAAAVGIFVFLVDILYFPGDQYHQHAVDWKIAQGISTTILFFAILEFFIGILASHSCYYALNYQDDEATCLIQ